MGFYCIPMELVLKLNGYYWLMKGVCYAFGIIMLVPNCCYYEGYEFVIMYGLFMLDMKGLGCCI